MRIDKDEGKRFHDYIATLRQEQNISLTDLCEGLCTVGLMTHMEKGERTPDKLIQDRMLERLGVSAEDYENFLDGEEYVRWHKRQSILSLIIHEKWEEAEKQLNAYEKEYNMGNRLERQFCLSMLAQLKRHNGSGDEKLENLFGEAVKLTVPNIDSKPVRKLVMSAREVNLVLEYIWCQKGENFAQKCGELLQYIESSRWDELNRAKIYPKVVYYLCRFWQEQRENGQEISWQEQSRLLKLCNRGIDCLRNTARMYYLWELVCIRGELLHERQEYFEQMGEVRKSKALQPMIAETENWRIALETSYEDYHVPKEMYEFCYLYVEPNAHCIGDVIRIRRKMMGMTMKELSENICDSRTVSRLERGIRISQRAIVRELFDRLNLPAEFRRTELVTESNGARVLMNQLREAINHWECDKATDLLGKIRELVSLEIPSNRQVLIRCETLIERQKGNITVEEYVEQVKDALECTIPYEVVCNSEEKYLTNEEITCIQNILGEVKRDDSESRQAIAILYDLYSQYDDESIGPNISMYEFVMSLIASRLGDWGEYKRSNEISKKIIVECLYFCRMNMLHSEIYNMLWNNEQQWKRDIPPKFKCNVTFELNKCAAISNLCRNNHDENFYKKKLKEQTKSDYL